MIQVAEIRRYTSSLTYQRGRRYYQDGYVRRMDVDVSEEHYGRVRVTGDVRGSGSRMYEVSLDISKEDEIEEYSCSCPAMDTYYGMCKHCVALALNFQEHQKRNRLTAVNRMAPGVQRNTSDSLRQMLLQYTMKSRRASGQDMGGDVRLECYFFTDPHGLTLECKIGSKRMYVVKNLVKLIRDVEEMRSVRYGATLEFVHEIGAFTRESQAIYQQIAQAVTSRLPDYQNSYYELSSNYRQILIPFQNLDSFLDLFLENGGRICVNEQDYEVRLGDPRPELMMRETLGGAELDMGVLNLYPGQNHTYVLEGHTFWCCSEEFVDAVIPIWKLLSRGQANGFRRQPHFLSREDYGSFCGNLLPQIRPFVELTTNGLNLEEYAPAEPEFFVYLEMPDEETVRASAKVRYEDKEFDLIQPLEGGGAYRNVAREQDVLQILNRYFEAVPDEEAEQRARERREAEKAAKLAERAKRRRRKQDLWDYGMPSRDLDEEPESPTGNVAASAGIGNAEKAQVIYHAWDMEEGDEAAPGVPEDYRFLSLYGEDALYQLVEKGLDEIRSAAELFVDDSIRRLQIQPSPKVSMGIGFSGNLLEMDVEMDGMDLAEIAQVLANYRRRKKYYRLKNGDFLRLEDNGLGTLSEISEGMQLSGKELASGHVELPMYRALYLEGVLGEDDSTQVQKTADYRRLVRNIRTYSDSDYEIPAGIQAKLRRYQREGFRWLRTLYEYGFGGILADDMGLGKTLQVITLFQDIVEHGISDKPMLVVSPASLIYNWEAEIARFAPQLKSLVVAGTAAERQAQLANALGCHVLITSYDLLKRDVDSYLEQEFDICVLDEAQYIKNAGTQAAKAVKKLKAAHRFALTGTPIENRLSDLWSIFDYLMPGYLFAYSRFRDEMESPIVKSQDSVAMSRLQRMVTPFLLRRRKQDVLKDLPDKLEKNIYVSMTTEQENLYLAHLNRVRLTLEGQNAQEFQRNKLQILKEITLLRRICCSPELLNYENYKGGSGKVDACMELLENAVDGGHRVLVFSQFTSMLELLMNQWRKKGKECLYLSGKDSKLHRKEMVEQFQTGDIPVFFISLKAGGTGLNLTAADMVIHCDPWWNVAAQNQATDRAHRIGQANVVNVVKLVAKGTIEEKILKLQDKKAQLADEVVEGEGVQDYTLNREELMEIFS